MDLDDVAQAGDCFVQCAHCAEKGGSTSDQAGARGAGTTGNTATKRSLSELWPLNWSIMKIMSFWFSHIYICIYIYIYVSRFFFVRHVIHYFLGWNHLNLQSGAPPLWAKIVGHIFLDDQCPKLTTVTSIIHYCIYSDMEVSNKNRVLLLLLFVNSSKFIAGFSLKPSSVRFGGSPGPGQLSLRGRQCQVLRSWKSSMDGLVLLRKATGFSMDFHC